MDAKKQQIDELLTRQRDINRFVRRNGDPEAIKIARRMSRRLRELRDAERDGDADRAFRALDRSLELNGKLTLLIPAHRFRWIC